MAERAHPEDAGFKDRYFGCIERYCAISKRDDIKIRGDFMNICSRIFGNIFCWVNFGKLEISETDMNRFNGFFKVEPNFKPISSVALGYWTQNIKKPIRESIEYYLIVRKNDQ